MKEKRRVYVIGHKNPDTDSICSAIAYADLKSKIDQGEFVPKRAGHINEETHYVLTKFGVKPPRYLKNVKLQVKDLDIHKTEGISPKVSIREAWVMMKENNIKTLPVLEKGNLVGLISTGDIARSYMEVHESTTLAAAKTQYKNILSTLDGTLVTGNPHGIFVEGKVAIGASDSKRMEEFICENDMVILGNRQDAQEVALKINACCLIICGNEHVSEALIKKAEEQDIVVIQTPHDTFTAARLINQSVPVKQFMTKGPLMTFKLNDYVDDIKTSMTSKKYRDFPILDEHKNFVGFISRRRTMNATKKQVILVDHNEKSQAIEGIEEAEIIEIIDHHRIGSLETLSPVFFRNQPVGCTATIVAQMYEEARVEIPKEIAGLLASAIVSDTLLFRSPTSTKADEGAAKKLAQIAEIDLEDLAKGMFRAGSSLEGKTENEIANQDFKQFAVDQTNFGVGQISSMDVEELKEIKNKLIPYLPGFMKKKNLDMVFFMLTNILTETSELICVGNQAREHIIEAFELPENTKDILLKGVVSRKKQLIPTLMSELQQ